MPPVGFRCPLERITVGWDHFEHCTALRGRPAFPPWLARMIAERAIGDVRHAARELTATGCMSCPRQNAIARELPMYIDPAESVAAARGTALHETAARWLDPAYWYSEGNDPMRLQVHGRLFAGIYGPDGIAISAQVDAIRRDMREIVDWKFPKDWSVRYRRNLGGKARPEYAVQLNIARLLLAQQDWAIAEGYDPANVMLTIWDHALGDREGPEPLDAPLLTEQEILDTTPYGDYYTVSDIVSATLDAHERLATVEPAAVEQAIALIPLIGEQMMGGQKCTAYCGVNTVCDRLVRQYGRPDVVQEP